MASPGGTLAATPGGGTPGQLSAQQTGAGLGGGMAASFVPAYIQCLELPIPPIVFPFNPEEYNIGNETNWIRAPAAAGNVPPMWGGLKQRSCTVNILLDTFSVPPSPPQAAITQLKLMMTPTLVSLGLNNASPPTVTFGWGPNIIFYQATVDKVDIKYHRFLGGVPVRATATVRLVEVPPPFPLGMTNPTSGGLAPLRTRTLVEGDTLASIAHEEYKDPNKWRALAEANKIDDPMRVKAGSVIMVPDRRDAESLS